MHNMFNQQPIANEIAPCFLQWDCIAADCRVGSHPNSGAKDPLTLLQIVKENDGVHLAVH